MDVKSTKVIKSTTARESPSSTSVQKSRVVFIDLLRTYAILMMLQGHTVDMVLDPVFRTDDYAIYAAWNYMRGITAPVFFFASGMIATILLLRESIVHQWTNNTNVENYGGIVNNGRSFPHSIQNFPHNRIRKTLFRGGLLIVLGYFLRFQPSILFADSMQESHSAWKHFLRVDVLQCIGIGLIFVTFMVVLLNLIVKDIRKKDVSKKTALLTGIFASVAVAIFLVHPFVEDNFTALAAKQFLPQNTSMDLVKLWCINFFTKFHGSTFTLIPWLGFLFFGSAVGSLIVRFQNAQSAFLRNILSSWTYTIACIMIGFALTHFTSETFKILWQLTDWEIFHRQFLRNFAFYRLGNVFIVMGIASAVSIVWRNIPQKILRIGQNTLFLYVGHAFLLYGSIFHIGFGYQYRGQYSPWESVLAASSMLIVMVALVQVFHNTRNNFNGMINRYFND